MGGFYTVPSSRCYAGQGHSERRNFTILRFYGIREAADRAQTRDEVYEEVARKLLPGEVKKRK